MKIHLPLFALALAIAPVQAQKAPVFHTLDGRTLRLADIDRTVR